MRYYLFKPRLKEKRKNVVVQSTTFEFRNFLRRKLLQSVVYVSQKIVNNLWSRLLSE